MDTLKYSLYCRIEQIKIELAYLKKEQKDNTQDKKEIQLREELEWLIKLTENKPL